MVADSQAHRIVAKFGGARALTRALHALGDPTIVRDPSVVYRWTYPKGRGRGGLIPVHVWPALFRAARQQGIFLTDDDLRYRPLPS